MESYSLIEECQDICHYDLISAIIALKPGIPHFRVRDLDSGLYWLTLSDQDMERLFEQAPNGFRSGFEETIGGMENLCLLRSVSKDCEYSIMPKSSRKRVEDYFQSTYGPKRLQEMIPFAELVWKLVETIRCFSPEDFFESKDLMFSLSPS